MPFGCRSVCRPVVWLTLCAMLAGQAGLAPAYAQTNAGATSGTSSPQPADGGWPRPYTAADGARLVVYQPQVASWENQKLLTAWAAMSYTPAASQTPLLGSIELEADTKVSVAARLVDFSTLRVLRASFPQASREQSAAAVEAFKTGMPLDQRVIALDRVLAAVDTSSIRPRNHEGVKGDPPKIFYSTRPAVMVNTDGDPIWSPIKDNELRFAVNTNWDLFEHPPSKALYLRHEKVWLTAPAVDGPWTAAKTLPASFQKLPAGEDWNDVRAALPLKVPTSWPRVFVSTTPAELIAVTGAPFYVPVAGTRLVWVRNTDADVFRLGETGPVYYLVSGRWFSAPGFTGPWTFATPQLPEDFARIPLEHERSRVLASVPGTPQANEAVLLAQIPQTARVNKKTVPAPEVGYHGDPQFEPIASTTVSRAVNTDKDIIKVGDLYYMCFQGVWFMGRSPTGPWEVTGSVPGEIYEIPISSPAHNVTYVTVDDDDDEWVTYATAAAYGGAMVAWGCVVWGSGWYYPPGVWYGGYYPAYFPYYPTYGYGASYNPWTGAYGRSAAVYGPYGGAGVSARYNPRTGTYSRGAAAWGPYGARGAGEAYNPRTGAYGRTQQGAGVYGSWGVSGVQRGDSWAATGRVTNRATGTTTRGTTTSGGGAAVTRRGPQGSGFVGQTGSGDVYAGRDGNVYKREGDSWQQYGSGGWGEAQRPAGTAGTTRSSDPTTTGQLNRDAAARSNGATRANDAARVNSGSGAARSGSYRPSGGTRGGGGRRR